METLKGISASKGIAVGTVFYLHDKEEKIERVTVGNSANEITRFQAAQQKAIKDLEEICETKKGIIDDKSLEIFRIHAMMLEDADYIESIENMIKDQSVNAEYAVQQTSVLFAAMFEEMEDAYMKARSADVKDISRRIVRILQGKEKPLLANVEEPVVLAAEELMPSETVTLEKDKVLAFVTMGGSKISHSAILAKTLGIPAVVALKDEYLKITEGERIVVDGTQGIVIINPTQAVIDEYKQKKEKYAIRQQQLKDLIGKESISLDNIKVEVNANIGHLSDVKIAKENDAEGVGLFRSEFLYMESDDFPSEDAQFEAYSKVLKEMGNKLVVIRTLDLGADKQAPYFNLPKEDNPAMGYRAIRICLSQKEIFTTQIRALLRASVYGNLAVMFPMIVSVEEVLEIKKEIEMIKSKLKLQGIKYSDNIQWGIMVETPAAAMITDKLAPLVDFFSIGTNDLTQYTLAVDRMNAKISNLYDTHHRAILRLIQITAENARKNGIWCGICGETASDLELVPVYMALGVNELSVTPTAVLEVREKIRETKVSAVKDEMLNKFVN